jgi:hypothetical protein
MDRAVAPAFRLPLLAAGFVALFLGIGAGLARMGWDFPLPNASLPAWHAPLMIAGFFGTVIGLERAVALAKRWAYLAPLASALGAIALLLARPLAAQLLFLLAATAFVAASLAVYAKQRALHTFTPALGAACWAAGSALWLAGAALAAVVPWWIAFLVLTIAGERLELSRLLPRPAAAQRAFAFIVAAIAASLVLAFVARTFAQAALGASLLALAGWLARHDIARRTVRGRGLPRFVAVCLLSGYAWLAAGALFMLAGPWLPGFARDAGLHAILIGFVFSMVFGHAPIIFPAVTGSAVPYHATFYLPLALLQGSLALRVAGDFAALPGWRSAGAAAGAVALALFVAGTAAAVARGRLSGRPPA